MEILSDHKQIASAMITSLREILCGSDLIMEMN